MIINGFLDDRSFCDALHKIDNKNNSFERIRNAVNLPSAAFAVEIEHVKDKVCLCLFLFDLDRTVLVVSILLRSQCLWYPTIMHWFSVLITYIMFVSHDAFYISCCVSVCLSFMSNECIINYYTAILRLVVCCDGLLCGGRTGEERGGGSG